MKMNLLAIGLVVVIVGVAGFFFWPKEAPDQNEALDTTQEAQDVTEVTTDADAQGGQFIQVAPTTIPNGSDTEVTPNDTTSVSPVAVPTGATVTIIVDEDGFTPQTVTVTAGTTVKFVNNGQALHWPASDVHPTHQILPEFDSNRGLATGEEYSFTFTQTGSWQCHDHLAARNTCTITVK